MSTSKLTNPGKAAPDFERYAGLTDSDPSSGWPALLARFRGVELGIVAICLVAIFARTEFVPAVAILGITLICLASNMQWWTSHATTSKEARAGPSKPENESGHASTA